MRLAITSVALLQGLLFAKIYNYSALPYDITFSTSIATYPSVYPVRGPGDTIHLLMRNDPGLKLPNGYQFWSTTGPFVGGNSIYRSRNSMIWGSAAIVNYENNQCDNPIGNGKIEASTAYEYYVYTMNFPNEAWCYSFYGGSTGEYFWQCYGDKSATVPPPILTQYYPPFTYVIGSSPAKYVGYCMKGEVYSTASTFYIRVKYVGDNPIDRDTCAPMAPVSCQTCAWPYLSVPDSSGCGCVVDPTKLQSDSRLKLIAYAYCNSVTDSSGSTYYLDYSRSNFDPQNGVIRAVCSSPTTGKSITMPSNSCPSGTYVPLDPFPDSLALEYDSAYQNNKGAKSNDVQDTASRNRLDSILHNVGRGDTATHNRLDTIIELLRNNSGGSGGYDSTLVPKLDSLRSFLDTAGGSSYDSAKSRLQFVFDSLNSDTLQYRPYIDSIISNMNMHVSRGDTSIANGITVDSILNFCVTFNDSLHCFSDTPIYPYMVASVKWIRRFCLALWAFICAGIFFSISTGGNKND